jgi:protein-glutamine gamma-glutamyltransferase
MPRLHTLFRFSTYLTLTLATICIGLTAANSEMEGGVGFYLVVGLAILVAYLCEDRWLVPTRTANLLAVVIVAGWFIWSRFSLRGTSFSDDAGTDLLRLMLPRAGPLLSVLMLVKLFRPKKAVDYWMLHALALVQVVLACVLALSTRLDRENLLFPSLLTLYVVSGVWSMVIFYLQRELVAAAPPERVRTATLPVTPRAISPWRSLGLLPSLAWFVGAFLIALVLFFLMPRPGHDAAATFVVPGMAQPSTGFNPGVDLNHVGLLRVNEELVMHVQARDQFDRPINLGGDQRFRGVTCGDYLNGRWRPSRSQDQRPLTLTSGPPVGQEGHISLTYTIDMSKIGGSGQSPGDAMGGNTAIFLADPMSSPATIPMIRIESRTERHQTLMYRHVEPALLAANFRRSRNLAYTEWTRPPQSSDGTWVQILSRRVAPLTPEVYYAELGRLPPRVVESRKIAQESARILAAANVPPDASAESKARALEAYLATSGQFSYSLEWLRKDHELDPTEDFLLNVKQGHCELFASALALMLRSQGIHSRVVIGFRGSEWNSLGEYNEVRQYHAHAWVEALLDRRWDSILSDTQYWTWLTLDATPSGGTAGAVGAENRRGAWDEEVDFLQYLWESLILDYGGDNERERLMNKLARFEWLKSVWQFWSELATFSKIATVILGMAAALGLVLVVLRRRRRRAAKRAGIAVAFYARLVQLLERIALRPGPAQTAAEFSAEAALALARRPAAAGLAALPGRIAELFYAVRFGGQTLDAENLQRIDRELDQLQQALRS